MKKSKLITLLKSLTEEEFRWLNKFIRSPFHNSNKHIIAFYEQLRRFYPEFDHPRLTMELQFKKLFPGETYDVQRLRLIMHRFAALVEAFVVATHLRKNKFEAKKLLTRELSERNTYHFFERKTMELLSELEASPIRDKSYYLEKEVLNTQYYAHPATNRQQKGMEHLTAAMDSLDDYFILSKLRLACAMKARTHTLSEEFEFNLLNVILENSAPGNILISIYSKVWELQHSEDDTNIFRDVRTLYLENIERLGQEDRRNVLHFLLNFCTRLVNKGKFNFVQNSLELYKLGLTHKILIINKELTETTFNNIVSLGIACKEFNWTKSFIEQYGNQLDKKVRTDAITYSWALWYFKQHEFEKTTQFLLNHQFTKPLQIVSAKSLLIRTYVELFLSDDTYYDLSIAQINTFEKYIRNNQFVSKTVSEAYLNFVRLTKKFIKLKFQNKGLDNFKAKLQAAQNLILKEWLLDKSGN